MAAATYKANLEKLSDILGQALTTRLEQVDDRRIGLTGHLEQGSLNAHLDGNPIYPGDALAAARDQVAHYAGDPVRLFGAKPTFEEEEWQRLFGYERLHETVIRSLYGVLGEGLLQEEPGPDGGFLISLGLGLGCHLPLLLDRYDVRNLIIIEPHAELIKLSLQGMDWAAVRERLEQRGGSLHLLSHQDPGQAAAELVHLTRNRDYALFDGSYVFKHYDSGYFDDFAGKLSDLLPTRLNAMGFFEDECLMLRNSIRNLGLHDHGLFRNEVVRLRDRPAFILASGPSLDDCLEVVRENRERAVYFSAGTGISALLEQGIVPDFHCEVENFPFIHDVLSSLKQVERLKEVTLIAPTTVTPELAALFGRVIFLFRDSVTPSRLFSDDRHTISLSGPTVTNQAVRAALGFGFTDLYLFGVDLGAVEGGQHHSKSSVYYTDGSELMESGLGLADFSIAVAGNFRERAHTNRIYIYARSYLEKLISLCNGQRVHNCSNGVRIKGAAPLPPEAVNLASGGSAVADLVKGIVTDYAGDGRARMTGAAIDDFERESGRWLARLRMVCRDPALVDFNAFHDALAPFLQQGHGDSTGGAAGAARVLYSGTVYMVLQSLHYLGRRSGGAVAAKMLEQAKSGLLAAADRMEAETMDMITEAREGAKAP